MDPAIPQKPRFANPPIVQRIIGVYYDIPTEVFEAKIPSWEDRIRPQYPISKPIAEWTVNFKEVNGVPVLQETHPTASIIRRYWKPHPKNREVYCMRVRPDRLVFHLCREPDNVHDFEELFAEMHDWILPWAEHFSVPFLNGITVEYVNVIDGIITPQFIVPGTTTINIGEVLEIFATTPGRYKKLTNPYDCRLRLNIDPAKCRVFDFRVRGQDSENPPRHGVRIDFRVSGISPNRKVSLLDGLNELREAHELMLEQFSCFFTKKARESFNPDATHR